MKVCLHKLTPYSSPTDTWTIQPICPSLTDRPPCIVERQQKSFCKLARALDGIDFRTFRTGDKKKIDCLEVEPTHVDHLIPSACGFIIHTSADALVYTGDFRFHVSKPQMTQDLVEAAKNEKPVAVVT
ncbi:hypothetical protein MUO56_03900 [Candidatus Bathyarchaeota archaeon]|nr:hypothetical protein [Candidatus Bathyarchaeota archaeon]